MGSGLRGQDGRGDVFYDLASAVTSTASYWLCKSALFTWEGQYKDVSVRLLGAIVEAHTGLGLTRGKLGVLWREGSKAERQKLVNGWSRCLSRT